MKQTLYHLSLIKTGDLHDGKKWQWTKHKSLGFHHKACENLFPLKKQHLLIVLSQLTLSFAVMDKKKMVQKCFFIIIIIFLNYNLTVKEMEGMPFSPNFCLFVYQ